MELKDLNAISPVDGRYRPKVEELADYFSEFGLIKYRLMIEIEYFISLCQIPLPQLKEIDESMFDKLREIYRELRIEDADKVKQIEKTTNHDVKAVEYYIREAMENMGMGSYKEFVHFALTSQDVNNTAVPASIRDALNNIYYPYLND